MLVLGIELMSSVSIRVLTNELSFYPLFCFSETVSHYVALASLELYVNQAGLRHTEIHMLQPPQCWG